MISSGDGIFSCRQRAHRSVGREPVITDSSSVATAIFHVAPAKLSWCASVVDNDEEGAWD